VGYLPGWDSLDAVTRYHSWAELVGIGLLALLVVAELLSFSYGGRKDDLTEQQEETAKRAHETEIAALHKDTARLTLESDAAQAQIATAQKDMEQAKERTATLENQALSLQRQTADAQTEAAEATALAARVQQAANWRVISKEQTTSLVAQLAADSGAQVTISYPANDDECLFLVAQIEGVFRRANIAAGKQLWADQADPRTYAHAIFWGIRIFGQDPVLVQLVRNAFLAAGIETSAEAVPNMIDAPGMRMGLGPVPPVEIYVGPRPPPNFSP